MQEVIGSTPLSSTLENKGPQRNLRPFLFAALATFYWPDTSHPKSRPGGSISVYFPDSFDLSGFGHSLRSLPASLICSAEIKQKKVFHLKKIPRNQAQNAFILFSVKGGHFTLFKNEGMRQYDVSYLELFWHISGVDKLRSRLFAKFYYYD